jgi:hypothetical protein
MSLRKILIAAAVAAPLALSPVQASAQQGRGAEAREQAHQYGGQTVTQLPPGIAQRVERGGTVPPGIDRRYAPPEPEPVPDVQPEPEPEPEPEPQPCSPLPVFQNGAWYLDCNGTLIPL